MRMIDPKDIAAEQARQQLLLLTWFSPAFPIGAFAFSHGLEWAQETGALAGRAGLEEWIGDLLDHGSGRTDAILLGEAWRLAGRGDQEAISVLTDLAAALQPGRERWMEANVQGRAFIAMVQAASPEVALLLPRDPSRLTLPVAAGLCGAAHAVALPALLTAAIAGFVANLCSAAVRLGIVGQTDGQRVIVALHPRIAALAGAAEALTPEDLGSAALRSDLFSLQHETQYSRLFRS
jgi:urease accessory protein